MRDDIDLARVERFGNRLVEMLNGCGTALMLSLGHRTGLFDAMEHEPPATSEAIANKAKLSERYVREWLGAMVAGGIIDFDEHNKTYQLPDEHAAMLSRSSNTNLASSMQWIAVLGHVEDDVLEAFSHGQGVPYSAYHRFHEVMAEESAQTVVAALEDHIVPLVPGLVERLEAGIDVLDVGCGSGRAINALAARFPKSRFAGYDFSEEAIAAARTEAERRGLANARFVARDLAEMDERNAFDLVMAFDAIHDQAKPAEVLANIAKALRPGGVFLMQDIAGTSHVHEDKKHPLGAFLYSISCMHCMSVSLAHGGPGLGAMWGKKVALEMLAAAGFGNVEVKELPHDIMNYYYISRTTA
ncbi:MAG: transcriptional regulator [Planctomycetota bacterium]|nr:MAG: transcriptional regulator [Planctomycetota bacterium]